MVGLKLEIKAGDNYNHFLLSGILNIDNNKEFFTEIGCIGFDKIIIFDLLELSYIDSSGIAIIIEIFRKLQENNLNLYAYNLCEKVLTIFKNVGLIKFIKILDTNSIKKILNK